MIVKVNTKCPSCNHVHQDSVPIEPIQLAPVNRSNLKPMSNIFEYHITSDQIKRYLIDKAKKYATEVRMEVVPRFIERKRKENSDRHAAYASLRIAFSENVIEKNEENGWFGKIGESENPRIIKSIFQNFIARFNYDRESLKKIRDSYKLMENLEDTLGITEEYLDDLIMFSVPRLQTATNGVRWVFFAASAEKVLMDMLTIAETGEAPGRIEIKDTIQISKDSVEYVVHVHSNKVVTEDPSVRRILLGEEKAKN